MSAKEKHEIFLKRAIEIANLNIDNGGRPFGCVVVNNHDGEIIIETVNTMHINNDPTAHAELNAIREIGIGKKGTMMEIFTNCTIYASGQPCPMCLSAMHLVKVPNVYYVNSNQDGEPFKLSTASILDQLSKPLSQQSINIYHLPISNSLYEKWFNKQQQQLK